MEEIKEPLEYLSRSKLQLNIMKNIERMILNLPKNNSFRVFWINSPNWCKVQSIINTNTSKAGSSSSFDQCKFIGADPDGYTFFNGTDSQL